MYEYERAQIMTSRSLTIRTRPLRSVSLARGFNCELLRGGRSLHINIIVLKEMRVNDIVAIPLEIVFSCVIVTCICIAMVTFCYVTVAIFVNFYLAYHFLRKLRVSIN